MENNYALDLELPITHPLKNLDCIHRDGTEPDIFFISHDDVSDEYMQWIDEQGLVMTYPPLIFYTPASHQIGIHIDGPGEIMDRVCMNWQVQGAGSLMHWYDIKEGHGPFEETETQAGTPYAQYHPKDLDHAFSHATKFPSMVRTGIPHNIHNSKWEPRWTISCDLSFKATPEGGLKMDQAKEIFNKWTV